MKAPYHKARIIELQDGGSTLYLVRCHGEFRFAHCSIAAGLFAAQLEEIANKPKHA